MRLGRVFLLCVMLVLCALTNAWCCAPNIPEAVFSYSLHPDAPYEGFAKGNLGVLRPTYTITYLVAAYRYLNGPGFDSKEQKALINFWQKGRYYGHGDRELMERWEKAIQKMTGIATNQQQGYREIPDSHSWYLNCTSDAFETALKTLNARIRQFGEKSPEVREWLSAQQIVFHNCDEGPEFPPPANENTVPLIKKDRAYQIAAAHFYSEQFDEAERMFGEIAKDKDSPWSKIAPYLAVRALVRKADLIEGQSAKDSLQKAKSELLNILADPGQGEIHGPSKRLLNTVSYRLAPVERLNELSAALMQEHSSEEIVERLEDFRYMFNEGTRGNHDLVMWIDAYQHKNFKDSFQMWQQTHGPHWLLATLSSIAPNDPHLPDLLREADNINENSPSYASILYERLRLMMQAGLKEEARKKLDQFLAAHGNSLPISGANLFAALRMQLATSPEEFVTYGKRRPAGLEWPVEEEDMTKELAIRLKSEFFYLNSTWILNRELPLAMLVKVSEEALLPEDLRVQVAISAWIRAVLLQRTEEALKLANILKALVPSLKKDLNSYSSAKSREERQFVFAYIILKNPGMQPFLHSGFGRDTSLDKVESYRDNWWCAIKAELDKMDRKRRYLGGEDKMILRPDFIREEDSLVAQKEFGVLADVEAGPLYLGKIVLQYAKNNPTDSRSAEALHLTVRATRYGCWQRESEISRISQAAFKLLHQNYPESSWTKKTPYWF